MKKYFILFPAVCIALTQSLSAKIWINEFMQSNIDWVRDDLQEFPDSWVELYNDSGQDVDIQDWYISETQDYSQGWRFDQPALVPAQGYILVYCDKAASGLHTSFHLDSGNGGSIYLFDTDKNVIDSVTFIPKQPAPNISRGRTIDGGPVWENFVMSSPNQPNGGKFSDRVLENPVFSQPGGIFKDSVRVSLSLPANLPAEVTMSNIHYTLDHSEPTVDSPVYSEELIIPETAVLKAKIIHPDYLTNRSQAHSYIIVSKDMELPVISISLDESYLWDEEFGIYCQGNGVYGKEGNGVDYKANWNNDWRRPVNFEYFPAPNKGAVLNQLGEMRISGGWSRASVQKPLIIYGHKRFGIKNFDHDLFNEKPGQDIRSFMIRNSGNDFFSTHFRDAAIQLFMGRKVDVDYQEYQPAIFYLNGKYWGIQNLRERSNEDFVLANYGTEDIDLIENWWGDLKTGDLADWYRLMSELWKSPNQIDYQWLMDQIDINEYINYMILEIYVSNTDFPHNNMVMWKPKTTAGKWRFILKDLDHGLGIWEANPVDHNALQYNMENNDDERKLFRALLSQDSFKKEFYSRFAIYLGDILHYNATSQIMDSIQQMLEPVMENHLLRWRDEETQWWMNMDFWHNEINLMKNWCQERNAHVYTHLKEFFDLGTVMAMTLETSPDLKESPVVSINGITLQKPVFAGSYFQGETIRLRLEGDDTALYAWEITAVIDSTTTTRTYLPSDLTYEIADQCTSLRIKVIDKPTAITPVDFSTIAISTGNNQLYVSGLEGKSRISVYDTAGRLISQMQTDDYAAYLPVYQKGVMIVKVNSPAQVICRKIIIQ